MITKRLSLVEGQHYRRVCMGHGGFPAMMDELAGLPTASVEKCDIAVSSTTATVERARDGILFSSPTFRDSLAIMTYQAPDEASKQGSELVNWLEPIHRDVWFSALAAVMLLPFLIFFLEIGFSRRCDLSMRRRLCAAYTPHCVGARKPDACESCRPHWRQGAAYTLTECLSLAENHRPPSAAP